MEAILNNQGDIRKYEKPETKKHEAINIVQGSGLYYSDTYYYTSLYKVSLYYYY
jgi:hypothetical protein